jgi:hypothetical protein
MVLGAFAVLDPGIDLDHLPRGSYLVHREVWLMRLYAYTNMYTEGIHAGIQTAHVIGELNAKYQEDNHSEEWMVLLDWQMNHKTIYVYNGGLADMLWSRYKALREFANKFGLPIARFYESKEALNGALTCVGIVVPEKYYRRHLIPTAPPIALLNGTDGLGNVLRPPKSAEEEFYDLLHNCERAR